MTRVMRLRACVMVAVVVLALASAHAQADQSAAADAVRPEVEGAVETPPASLSVTLFGGLPAYRSVGVAAALRADPFGVALRGGWGSVGASFGAQVRWYPPLPSPVPLYLAAGADTYVGSVTPHAVVGAHVPLGGQWRLDVEGGAARATLGGNPVWTAHLSVGVSYAFVLDVPDATAAAADSDDGAPGAPRRAGAVCVPGDPDSAALSRDVDVAVRAFVREGVALYGNAYRDLRYRYSIVSESIDGDVAEVRIRYSGSARAVLSGERVEASGTASATFRWTGCRWQRTSVSY